MREGGRWHRRFHLFYFLTDRPSLGRGHTHNYRHSVGPREGRKEGRREGRKKGRNEGGFLHLFGFLSRGRTQSRMKISVKTLKGNHFDLDVSPSDTVRV